MNMNPGIIRAMQFAIKAHAETNHTYDQYPYSIHLSMVSFFAQKYIYLIPKEKQEVILCACWLHDTIQYCRISYNDLCDEFGHLIADIVYAVTNDKGNKRGEKEADKYYSGILNTDGAVFVKLCDRLANIHYSASTSFTLSNDKMFKTYKNEHDNFVLKLSPTITLFNEMELEMAKMLNLLPF